MCSFFSGHKASCLWFIRHYLMAANGDSSQGTLIMLGCNLVTILLVSYWVKTHYNGPKKKLKNPLEIHIINIF